ncbi:hypothetical protein D9M73_180000 [compost metagenome]
MRGRQGECRAEQRPGNQHARRLAQATQQKHPLAAGGDIIHRHHRQNGHGAKRIELERRDPKTTAQRIVKQIAAFGLVGKGRAARQLISEMRPDKTIERQQNPDPHRQVQRIQGSGHTQTADAQANGSRHVDASGK